MISGWTPALLSLANPRKGLFGTVDIPHNLADSRSQVFFPVSRTPPAVPGGERWSALKKIESLCPFCDSSFVYLTGRRIQPQGCKTLKASPRPEAERSK